ncbi:MAG: phosphatase PAP2 family protein, partial [Bacteroidota bacterium]
VNNFAGAIVLSHFLKKWRWGFSLFAFTVSFSRVYVGVHYPSDIFSGAVIGSGCGALIVYLFTQAEEWWNTRKARNKDTQPESNT